MKKYIYWIIGAIGLAALFTKRKELTDTVNRMLYPIYSRITSGFGNRIHPVTGLQSFHNGIDLAGKIGDDVRSPADGIVTGIFSNSIGGNQLTIKHKNGYTSGYAHLSEILVNIGEEVKQGWIVAKVGDTGQVTGPHLHFSLKDNSGKNIDPILVLIA